MLWVGGAWDKIKDWFGGSNPLVPQYQHDCMRCVFLGRFRVEEGRYKGRYDLYVCPSVEFEAVVIARFGKAHYYMGWFSENENIALAEAARRAKVEGWVLGWR